MAHKFPNVLVHLVFSTKDRQDLLVDDVLRNRLWKYFVGIGKNHGIAVLAADGTANHAHLLIVLPSDMSVAKAVQVLKANSSRWLSEHGIDFSWQEGYGAFSVSPSQIAVVKKYIEQQAAHHAARSYEEEFLSLLNKTGMHYEKDQVFG
ncbi:MAG: IS200/IS605 family transposase [Acidobacteriia bacterium]|nr:IS200/IS605 family transposase [Terriglobia bacterium]